MKRLLLLLSCCAASLAQTPTTSTLVFKYVGPLNSWKFQPCSWTTGDMAFATDASVQGQNLYVCAPYSSTWTLVGVPSGSVSGLAASATTDTTNASNITSGTLSQARLSIVNTDNAMFIEPSTCWFFPTTVTTTTTLITLGASNVPVLNSTTNSAAGSLTLQCYIPIAARITAGKGVTINDVTVMYGLQTSAATSINGAAVSTITFPTAAATETPSTVTPVAIPGSVTQSSTTGNLAVTTAGAFYTSKLTLATPFNVSTDLQALLVTLVFNNTATSVLTVNTPGLMVHYTETVN